MKSSAETYFSALAEIRATGGGVQETSYYPALMNLLNDVGATLKPRVLAVSQLQNTGAGNPDAGLFTANQLPKGVAEPLPGQLPERGVVEIKGMVDDELKAFSRCVNFSVPAGACTTSSAAMC